MSETSRAEADDASYIERSRRDPEVFAEVFRRHAPDITRYVTRRIGDDAADDVVAETFLAAFRQRDGYDLSRRSARPWLYGIATNLVRRHVRTEVRHLRLVERTGADPVTASFSDRSDERLSGHPCGYSTISVCIVWPGRRMAHISGNARHEVRGDPALSGPVNQYSAFRNIRTRTAVLRGGLQGFTVDGPA